MTTKKATKKKQEAPKEAPVMSENTTIDSTTEAATKPPKKSNDELWPPTPLMATIPNLTRPELVELAHLCYEWAQSAVLEFKDRMSDKNIRKFRSEVDWLGQLSDRTSVFFMIEPDNEEDAEVYRFLTVLLRQVSMTLDQMNAKLQAYFTELEGAKQNEVPAKI